MKRWRMAILGMGWAGEQHALALRALRDRVDLCAIAEVDSARAEAKAREYEIPVWTTDYRTILDSRKLDAVCICLPHDLHAAATMDALDAGLHVLLEIPLANTLAEADAMIATADRTKLKLMVAEDVRFQNRFRKVAELIKSGAVGDVFLIRINREHEKHAYMRERPWWLAQKTGGIMVSGGIHDYEFLRMLAGEIEHVYGLEAPKAIPEMLADDTSVALIRLQSGAVAFFTESFSLKTPEPGVNGSVHGTGGSIWFSGNRVRAYTAAEDGHPELVEVVEVPPHNKFEAEDAHFLDCLDNDTEPLTSAREERKPLVAMLATYESFRRGGRVYVCEIESSDFNWDSWH